MGVRGQTWLALRAAERAQDVAFLDVCHERSRSARARPCVRAERAGYLQRLEVTYQIAVRTAGELRIELSHSQRAGVKIARTIGIAPATAIVVPMRKRGAPRRAAAAARAGMARAAAATAAAATAVARAVPVASLEPATVCGPRPDGRGLHGGFGWL